MSSLERSSSNAALSPRWVWPLYHDGPRSRPTDGIRPVSFKGASLQSEDNRLQGWMSAPVIASLVLVGLMFLKVGLQDVLPNKVFLTLVLVLVITTGLWIDANRTRLHGISAVECAMALYLMWNAYSMVAPHKYPAIDPHTA